MANPEKRWRVDSRQLRAKNMVLEYQGYKKVGVLTGANLQQTIHGEQTAALDPETVTPEQVDKIWGTAPIGITWVCCSACGSPSDITALVPDDFDYHFCETCLWEMLAAVKMARIKAENKAKAQETKS